MFQDIYIDPHGNLNISNNVDFGASGENVSNETLETITFLTDDIRLAILKSLSQSTKSTTTTTTDLPIVMTPEAVPTISPQDVLITTTSYSQPESQDDEGKTFPGPDDKKTSQTQIQPTTADPTVTQLPQTDTKHGEKVESRHSVDVSITTDDTDERATPTATMTDYDNVTLPAPRADNTAPTAVSYTHLTLPTKA